MLGCGFFILILIFLCLAVSFFQSPWQVSQKVYFGPSQQHTGAWHSGLKHTHTRAWHSGQKYTHPSMAQRPETHAHTSMAQRPKTHEHAKPQ